MPAPISGLTRSQTAQVNALDCASRETEARFRTLAAEISDQMPAPMMAKVRQLASLAQTMGEQSQAINDLIWTFTDANETRRATRKPTTRQLSIPQNPTTTTPPALTRPGVHTLR